MDKLNLTKSYELKERAKKVIPALNQTFSKGPNAFVQNASPVFIEKGDGCYLWDVDNNKYIDYSAALGPIILGYNHEAVNRAIVEKLKTGIVYSLPHPIELELSEELVNIIPCAEMVRFGKNGSDVTTAAVRLARAYTGREVIACCGYHGWHDWYIGTTTRNNGVPKSVQELTKSFVYNDIESLEKIFSENANQIAAIIMEPINVIEPGNNFLESVKSLAKKNGALLIFDEVKTGFRISLGGASQYYNIEPDLACFGKAMSNGMPLSAIVGKKEIMALFDDVFYSYTFAGETLSIAASLATIDFFKKNDVINSLWEKGKLLKQGINDLVKEIGCDHICECKGLPPRTIMEFYNTVNYDGNMIKSFFQQEAMKRGILFVGFHNICYAHSEDVILRTLKIYKEVFALTKEAIEKNNIEKELMGPPLKSVFKSLKI